MIKQPKTAVDYSRGHRESHCGRSFEGDKNYCRHYHAGSASEGTCEKVQGTIKAVYWCKLWLKAHEKRPA
jgi:hypothetical protein